MVASLTSTPHPLQSLKVHSSSPQEVSRGQLQILRERCFPYRRTESAGTNPFHPATFLSCRGMRRLELRQPSWHHERQAERITGYPEAVEPGSKDQQLQLSLTTLEWLNTSSLLRSFWWWFLLHAPKAFLGDTLPPLKPLLSREVNKLITCLFRVE